MKIKISKKNILEEQNCGEPGPDSMEAAPPDMSIDDMSPQEAYNMGYNEAIAEVMDMVSEMMSGGIPIDAPAPVDIADMNQLE